MKHFALYRMCSCKDLRNQAGANTTESPDAVCTYQDVSQSRRELCKETELWKPKYTDF